MGEHDGLRRLRAAARDRRPGQADRLKRALLVLAIPATATLATACYGAPMYVQQGERTYEAICDDGVDDDGDGTVDRADPDCASAKGCET